MYKPEDLELGGYNLEKEEHQTLAKLYCEFKEGQGSGDYNQLTMFEKDGKHYAVLDTGHRWLNGFAADTKTELALKLARFLLRNEAEDQPDEYELFELWQRAKW